MDSLCTCVIHINTNFRDWPTIMIFKERIQYLFVLFDLKWFGAVNAL